MRAIGNIPIDQCEEGYLYRIRARNIVLGVYTETPRPSFIGIRTKFGSRFLDKEYHYSIDARFGTATPVEKLELCPVVELKTQLDLVCRKCDQPMHHEGVVGSIRHVHDQPTGCADDWGWLKSNTPLFDYLDEAQKRFGAEE